MKAALSDECVDKLALMGVSVWPLDKAVCEAK